MPSMMTDTEYKPSPLRRFRFEANEISLRELGRRSGLDYTHLSLLERGERPLNVEQAISIAPHLNTTAAELLSSMAEWIEARKEVA